MATQSVNDTTAIDITDEDAGKFEASTIVIDAVEETVTDATEIKLTESTSLAVEEKGSIVLDGQFELKGTEDKPAGITLKSTDTSKTQVVVVSTTSAKNLVIATQAEKEGDQVAKVNATVTAKEVDGVKIKTASTQDKSVVNFTNESLKNAQIEVQEKGGDVTIKSQIVDGLNVSASGNEASNVTVDTETLNVSNAQIELANAGGTVEIKNSGSLSDSVIAVNSNTGVNNILSIDNEEVANTQLQLVGGNSDVEVKSKKVDQLTVSIDDSTDSQQDLTIKADAVTGFTLAVGSESATDVSLDASSTVTQTFISSDSDKKSKVTSKARLQETNVESTGSGITRLDAEKRATDTDLSNNGDGKLKTNFEAKAVDTKVSNEGEGITNAKFLGKTEGTRIKQEGKGVTKAKFRKAAEDVDIVTGDSKKKGDITVDFDARVDDMRVKAAGSKQSIELEFGKKVTNAKLDFGNKADSIVFGGKAADVTIDLGDDKASDTIEIADLSKISSPFKISSFGENDVLTIGSVSYSSGELQSNPSIFAPINIQFS